jgi:hypothetical protein
MSLTLKAGSRLKSTVCTVEVMVVRAPAGEVDLRCGGAAFGPAGSAVDGSPATGFDGGTLMGKRYVDEAGGLEVLCTKAGPGSLSIGETALSIKDAKPLPASD